MHIDSLKNTASQKFDRKKDAIRMKNSEVLCQSLEFKEKNHDKLHNLKEKFKWISLERLKGLNRRWCSCVRGNR